MDRAKLRIWLPKQSWGWFCSYFLVIESIAILALVKVLIGVPLNTRLIVAMLLCICIGILLGMRRKGDNNCGGVIRYRS
jgi:hypothetical protein